MTFTPQLSVKQLGWVSAPLSVSYGSFSIHQEVEDEMDSLNISSDVGVVLGCCGEERSFLFKSLCSNPHPWSWYQGNDRKIKVGNTSGHVSSAGYLCSALKMWLRSFGYPVRGSPGNFFQAHSTERWHQARPRIQWTDLTWPGKVSGFPSPNWKWCCGEGQLEYLCLLPPLQNFK